MSTPDPTLNALVLEVLTVLDEDATDADRSYIDRLRRLQEVIASALAGGTAVPEGEQEAIVTQALGRLDPRPDDARQPYQSRLRRVGEWVDTELFKWTSAMVQPPGPSGTTAVAATPPAPVE